MAAYSVADAKNRLPSLIDKALDGEEVVITRHGKPVAELRPRRWMTPEERQAFYDKMLEEASKRPVNISAVDLIRQERDEKPW